MSDNELLLAISDMMDTKLKPVNNQLEKMEDTLENNVIPRLEKMEDTLENNVIPRLEKVEQSQKKMELTLENNILPRLQTIEECYLSTFERYQSGVDQIEFMQNNIDVMKTTLEKHSEMFQKLA